MTFHCHCLKFGGNQRPRVDDLVSAISDHVLDFAVPRSAIAINVARKTRDAAYPSIAINAKIEALSGTNQSDQALALADEAIKKVRALNLAGHLYEIYQVRARVYEEKNDWNQAISDLNQSVQYARKLSYWRGITQVGGLLAGA